MVQVKMKYGIDLGTTNSAICKMENGEPVIRKTDTLKDTLPSCVSFTKKKVVRVGDSAMNDLRSDKSRCTKSMSNGGENVFIEFKRTMGLDTSYESSYMGRGYSSEELSAEVLKTLKSFISEENVTSAIITIPAKFKTDQIAATKRAATLAGITQCELLQEPIAASMAYGLSSEQKDGHWLVFDFGGGTFDAALLHVEDGIMQVIDTEGDNYLGGKNLDYAVVDGIIIPHLKENFVIDEIMSDEPKKQILRDAMKFYAEQAKNQLSFKDKCDITSQLDEFGEDDEGNELELDMVITAEQLKSVVTPIFQKAIDICKALIARNNLTGKLDTLILVGGPTYSPILRQMLREQITPNVDTSIDPMTAVARGAALYASGIDCESTVEVASGTIALDVNYESNSVETLEFVTVKLLPKDCTGAIPNKLYIELTRGDKGWSSGKVEVNELGDVIECQLVEGKSNSFSIVAYDETGSTLPCFPNEINIIQGTKIGNAVLPYHIGIEVRDTDLHKDVFMPLTGLEKNQQIPAVGVRNGLKTPKQIRPGNITDKLVIPIYLGEHNVEGSSAIYNDHVFDVVITGDDVPALIPANSDIDITIKVDRSQLLHMEATFPVIGETIEKDIEIGQRSAEEHKEELMSRYREGVRKLENLKASGIATAAELEDADKRLSDVSSRIDNEINQPGMMMGLLDDLRRAFLAMERVEKNHEWETLDKELREEFEKLEMANNELGHKYDNEVTALRKQIDDVIRQKDILYGRKVLSEIRSVFVGVTMIYQLIGFVRHHSQAFNSYNWTDPAKARTLLNEAMAMVQSNPSVERLHPIVCAIIELLPEGDKIQLG